jgi:predicted enzyme related to lactoylglutathione lyase/ketosteroid isomerase-like protein
MDAAAIARAFVARINERDVEGLAALMAEDHRFVDATGVAHVGRDAMRAGWVEYFACFPDYAIEVEDVIAREALASVIGWASGSFRGAGGAAAWRIPAAWRAEIRNGKLFEWRIYCDVEPMLRSMGLPRFAERPATAAGPRIAQFAVTVRDYDEALRFYVEKLGFERLEDTDLGGGKRWVRVRPPGAGGAGILLARAADARQLASVGNQTGGRVFVFIETDDFWRDYERLAARGVSFVRPPAEEPFGTVAVFEDLYGNRFDLIGRKDGRSARAQPGS